MKRLFGTKKWKHPAAVPVIVFLVVFALLSAVFLAAEEESVRQKREQYRYLALSESNLIIDRLDVIVARAYTVSAVIQNQNGSLENFQAVAKTCYEELANQYQVHLKNIAAAPDGAVSQVFPQEGNEGLTGFDFMDANRPGNLEAIEAYQKNELVVTNPFELVQGGIGMGARLPVQLGEGADRKFWGLITVTIDFEEFVESLQMEDLVRSGINYQVWYQNDAGEPVVLMQSENPVADPVTTAFSVANLNWNISVSPNGGWVRRLDYVMAFAIAFVVAVLCGLIAADKIRISRVNDQLMKMAFYDGLVPCHSRQYVNTSLLDQQTGKWKMYDAKYSLVLLDIDYFKQMNDTYGHAFGDRVLIAVAETINRHIREQNGDCVIRYGGDEFIILYQDVTRERFEEKLRDIVEAVRKLRFLDYPKARLTVSVGAEFYEDPEQSLYCHMMKRADDKLYQAKENGRNQYVL